MITLAGGGGGQGRGKRGGCMLLASKVPTLPKKPFAGSYQIKLGAKVIWSRQSTGVKGTKRGPAWRAYASPLGPRERM